VIQSENPYNQADTNWSVVFQEATLGLLSKVRIDKQAIHIL